jgi:hypothetical protein
MTISVVNIDASLECSVNGNGSIVVVAVVQSLVHVLISRNSTMKRAAHLPEKNAKSHLAKE